MREIGPLGQDSVHGTRRWFQDDYFDLYVWLDREGAMIGFQLCYDRGRNEKVIAWHCTRGFEHGRVDGGERGRHAAMTPLYRPDRPPPYFRIYQRFLGATELWDPALRHSMLTRLQAYRRLLFGAPRRPRRRIARRLAVGKAPVRLPPASEAAAAKAALKPQAKAPDPEVG